MGQISAGVRGYESYIIGKLGSSSGDRSVNSKKTNVSCSKICGRLIPVRCPSSHSENKYTGKEPIPAKTDTTQTTDKTPDLTCTEI